jgi:outer membrane protein assembly factor BamD (BamD/ComL family)
MTALSPRSSFFCVTLVTALGLSACGGPRNVAPPGAAPDRFLYDRGTAELMMQNWLQAREYFQRIVDGYPQSRRVPMRSRSATYLGENTIERSCMPQRVSRVPAVLPTHARADYAHRLAMSSPADEGAGTRSA